MTIWTVPPCNGQSARGLPVLPWMVSSACFSHHCSCTGVPNVFCYVRSPPDHLFCDGFVLFAVVYIYSDCEQVNNLNCNSTTFFVPNSTSKSL